MKQRLILCCLLLVTAASVQLAGLPRLAPQSGLPHSLPGRVGPWHGRDVLHCWNQECDKSLAAVITPGSAETQACPGCGGKLEHASAAERGSLPVGTEVRKRRYEHPSGRTMFVTMVMTGVRRTGIHRAEWCLPGQGYRIVGEGQLTVAIHSGKLPIALLDVVKQQSSSDGTVATSTATYAYWFHGNGRNVSTHLGRLAHMATDSIVHGVIHRWASFSVMTARTPGSQEHVREISEFLEIFYPALMAAGQNRPDSTDR